MFSRNTDKNAFIPAKFNCYLITISMLRLNDYHDSISYIFAISLRKDINCLITFRFM